MIQDWAWQPLDDLCGERYENSKDGAKCELPERLQRMINCRVPIKFVAELRKEEERAKHFIAGELYRDMHPMDIGV